MAPTGRPPLPGLPGGADVALEPHGPARGAAMLKFVR